MIYSRLQISQTVVQHSPNNLFTYAVLGRFLHIEIPMQNMPGMMQNGMSSIFYVPTVKYAKAYR